MSLFYTFFRRLKPVKYSAVIAFEQTLVVKGFAILCLCTHINSACLVTNFYCQCCRLHVTCSVHVHLTCEIIGMQTFSCSKVADDFQVTSGTM